MTDWLLNELDRSPQTFARQTVLEDQRAPVVRVFPLPQVQTQQAAQAIVNLIREMSELQRVAIFSGAGMNTVVARGQADGIALADWLVGQLQTPNGDASRAFGSRGESVKLFILRLRTTPSNWRRW